MQLCKIHCCRLDKTTVHGFAKLLLVTKIVVK